MRKYKVGDNVEFLVKRPGEMKREEGRIISERNSLFKGKKYIVEATAHDSLSFIKEEIVRCFEVKERDILGKIE